MKNIKLMLSAILLSSGIILLIDSSHSITGAFLGVSESDASFFSSLIGAILILSCIVLFESGASESELEKITLSSAIKRQEPLLKLTIEAVKNQTVERELNHLVAELGKGNFHAGLGRPGHIDGTDINYLRGRNGARLYYHQIGENSYEIVAKSGKGTNQDRVIRKIQEIYKN